MGVKARIWIDSLVYVNGCHPLHRIDHSAKQFALSLSTPSLMLRHLHIQLKVAGLVLVLFLGRKGMALLHLTAH